MHQNIFSLVFIFVILMTKYMYLFRYNCIRRWEKVYYSCPFFLDAVRFQGLGAILDWLTTCLDFM